MNNNMMNYDPNINPIHDIRHYLEEFGEGCVKKAFVNFPDGNWECHENANGLVDRLNGLYDAGYVLVNVNFDSPHGEAMNLFVEKGDVDKPNREHAILDDDTIELVVALMQNENR